MKIEYNAQLKEFSTLHIGGPAKMMAHPETVEEVQELVKNHDIHDIYIIGNGSNILFDDEGYDGLIIHIGAPFNHMELMEGGKVRVESGATNEQLAWFCAEHGLGGYEFASGIPGTVGGAIVMNAGAYNGETKEVLVGVEYVDENGQIVYKDKEDLSLSYRHSFFSENFGIVVCAYYQFEEKDPKLVEEKILDLKQKRWSKQPMEQYSAGSTFKRPEGYFASALIDQSGLRGYSHHDAAVSDKHTGFLINKGNASAKEFRELIEQVREKVHADHGVWLECEIKQVHSN
ncbi:UDP-N-acetylenolpyruvoylglucosamine reductase [Firmicutes bacterium M10-2]|nr:UDP-N-acetylenolpyruvoylglucosamine reductase [Firmicutes bacterium M10-2]